MSKTYDFDVTRAVGILNTAMRANMFAQGAIPESDADKIIAAEKVVASAEQALELANQIGKEKVPLYQSIVDVLFEAKVLVGSDQPQAANGSTPVEQDPPVVAPPDQPDARQLELEAEAAPMEKQSTWADPAGGIWTIVRDLGPQVEVLSAAGEPTVVPRGFLKVKVSDPPEPEPEPSATTATTTPAETIIKVAPKPAPKEEPSTTRSPPPSSPASSDTTPSLPSQPARGSGDSTPSSSSSSSPPASQGSSSSSEPAQEVDDIEGDEAYSRIVERAERDWRPVGMPVPRDMEDEPLPMVDDLTADESMNRRLHSQFNALAGRARYLGGLERAKAREIARARKLRMGPAMRDARKKLGKDATVTEVKEEAEQDEVVATWIVREARHADKAAAYQTFFEIYTENVRTLSRDLTWAGAEEAGS